MKKSLIILSTCLIALGSCSKDEVAEPLPNNTGNNNDNNDISLNLKINEDQNATLFFYTSTGCPGCGSWGGPTFKNLINNYATDVTPIAIHIKYNDPYISSVSQDIANNRTGSYYTPQLHIENTNIVVLNGGSIDGNASVQQANDSINGISSNTPIASSGSIYQVNDDKLTIKYGTQFHTAATGEFYVAAYIIEDGLVYAQSGANTSYVHNNVIRASVNGNSFGSLIKNGDIVADELFENQTSFPINQTWNLDNIKITTVIWEKVGNNYQVINSSVFHL